MYNTHKIIYTTCGKEVFVDEDDYPLLSRFNWDVCSSGYVRTSIQYKRIFMHRLILGVCTGGRIADHCNRNKLDNRKSNLRWASKQGNSANTSPRGPYGYKGVKKNAKGTRYVGYITLNGRQKYLGTFDSKEEAAKAYDKEAFTHFGDFAVLNFPHARVVS